MLQPISPKVTTRQRDKWYHSKSSAVGWQEHQPTHGCRVKKHGPSTMGKTHTQAMPNSKKGWDAENKSLKAHVSFIPQESNKPGVNGKRVRSRKVMSSDRSGACTQGSDTTYLYPANTGEVSHGPEVWEGVIWWWEERGAYFGVPTQTLLGKMSSRTFSPKKVNMNWNH